MKKSSDTIRNRPHNFLACSTVPQPTAPLHVLNFSHWHPTFVDPQYGTSFMPPFWHLQSLEHLCTPALWYVLHKKCYAEQSLLLPQYQVQLCQKIMYTDLTIVVWTYNCNTLMKILYYSCSILIITETLRLILTYLKKKIKQFFQERGHVFIITIMIFHVFLVVI